MITIVVGGQYGSEGKGKAAVRLLQDASHPISVRCGGPNAGHTVYLNGCKRVLRQVPSGVAVPGCRLMIAAGSSVNLDLLKQEVDEIESVGVPVLDRLTIDPMASVVTQEDILAENDGQLGARLGSTMTGTGWNAAQRILRKAKLVRDVDNLPFTIGIVASYLHRYYGYNIVIEGTQGFGLSLYHNENYPFCTSKDTTAGAFAMEAGIPPKMVDQVLMVVRTFPIRVGGNSGPMHAEITWEDIRKRSGRTDPLIEMTSVTKRVRRVGEWDQSLFKDACRYNQPSQIAIHGLDYLCNGDYGLTDYGQLSRESKLFISYLNQYAPVTMAFTGPLQEHMVYMP